MNFQRRWREAIKRGRRHACEALGSARYSRPALHELDRKLERWLDFNGGFFVEAGANDGFAQSNTYYFERMRGWTGLLIEPVPELCARCRRERPRSVIVQAALVAPDFPQEEIEVRYAGLMSVTAGAFGDDAQCERHLAAGLEQDGVTGTYAVRAPARTLSAILDAAAPGREIDLLSLDVEGYELPALAGLDLARHAPRFVCIEARDPDAVVQRLGPRYEMAELLWDNRTYRDLLFRRR
jgi:FkbM family methyltransferase